MSDEKEYLTQVKYDEFEKELLNLRKEKRKEIAEKLEYAKSLGDLSENAEYQEAREEQAHVESRIAYLKSLLQSAEIVSTKKTDTSTVGSKVTVVRGGSSTSEVFSLVGSEEIDTDAGKVSVNSPIGRGLLGRKKGDEVTVQTPKGDIVFAVKEIN